MINEAVADRKVKYMRVIGPSSMDREVREGESAGKRTKSWEGADYQLSFAFRLLECLRLDNSKLFYQEKEAVWPELEMLLAKGVSVLNREGK